MKRVAASLYMTLLLSACAVSQYVATTTTTFYVPDFHASGKLIVLPVNKELENSLEFAHYKRIIESKLAEHGYSISQNAAEADYFAYVSYGIDDGTQTQVPVPLFGQTGGGTTTYSSGTARTTGTQRLRYPP